MSDTTFGVKVTEEMKNELSELMKTSSLSGKEFMNLLLTTYKIEQAKREDPLLESDLRELQMLLQRIQHIYLNISERSKILISKQDKVYEEALSIHVQENELLKQKIKESEENLQHKLLEIKKQQEIILKEEEITKKMTHQVEESKNQVKNSLLLNSKFEQEVKQLENKIESLSRLELEIEERNAENTTLKNRNDDLASEVWFLKREVEKASEEKAHLAFKYDLEFKNNLLEQKINFNERIEVLKEENNKLQRDFGEKLQILYETSQNKDLNQENKIEI